MSEREEMRILALAAGIAVLAAPRRTRPLAGFLYGLLLSRAHGAALRRVDATMRDLFSQRTSAHERLALLEEAVEELEHFVLEQLGSSARAGERERGSKTGAEVL